MVLYRRNGGDIIKLIIRLGGSLLIYGMISIALVLLVLMPREISSQREGEIDVLSYQFSWNEYQENISNYLEGVRENKTLGMTIYNDPVEKELLYYGERSVKILVPAFIISLFLGVWKGVYDYRHGGWPAGRQRFHVAPSVTAGFLLHYDHSDDPVFLHAERNLETGYIWR